jgi:hypothetical protein
MKNILFIAALLLSFISFSQTTRIPHLEVRNGRTELIVNNEPFLMFSGELHNSSAGSAHHMRPIWARMARQNLNTVIAPVSWELTEPQEGVFDFSLVDSMIAGARKEKLKLVLLWFGSWKNGKSTYAPEWVKTDTEHFPLVRDKNGKTKDILSSLGENSLKADARAFTALMKHLKEIDEQHQTVLMVQVQNELGVLDYMASYGMPNNYYRDFCEEANQAFNGKVPVELMNYLEKHREALYPALKKAWAGNGYRKSGTWEEVFGKGSKYEGEDWKNNFSWYTEEIFMAWYYARYVGEIARQGKAAYALPMYANAWLKQSKSRQPGQYPSGGPLPHVLDIWRAAAPSIDFIAPDIYITEEFDWVCDEFTKSGNPLFIPETKTGPASASRAFYAFGKHNAIGYAPFGIDGGGLMLSANPDDLSLGKVYGCLQDLAPFIRKYKGTGNMTALFIDDKKRSDKADLGEYAVNIRRHNTAGSIGLVGVQVKEEIKEEEIATGIIIFKLTENEFLVAGGVGGALISVTKSALNKSENVGYAAVDEISFDNGVMKSHRLNGDETVYGGPVIRPGEVRIFKIKMYGY